MTYLLNDGNDLQRQLVVNLQFLIFKILHNIMSNCQSALTVRTHWLSTSQFDDCFNVHSQKVNVHSRNVKVHNQRAHSQNVLTSLTFYH